MEQRRTDVALCCSPGKNVPAWTFPDPDKSEDCGVLRKIPIQPLRQLAMYVHLSILYQQVNNLSFRMYTYIRRLNLYPRLPSDSAKQTVYSDISSSLLWCNIPDIWVQKYPEWCKDDLVHRRKPHPIHPKSVAFDRKLNIRLNHREQPNVTVNRERIGFRIPDALDVLLWGRGTKPSQQMLYRNPI
jgi:hypothetical protein